MEGAGNNGTRHRGGRGGRPASKDHQVSLRIGHALVRCDVAQLADAYQKLDRCAASSSAGNSAAIDGEQAVAGVVELALGPNVGVGKVCRLLKDHGFADLSKQVSGLRARRNLQAHSPALVAERVKKALDAIVREHGETCLADGTGASAVASQGDGSKGDDCSDGGLLTHAVAD